MGSHGSEAASPNLTCSYCAAAGQSLSTVCGAEDFDIFLKFEFDMAPGAQAHCVVS